MLRLCSLYVVFLISTSNCDIYLHNPRGSNNRLDEAGRERNNGNRLFDSQNNNRGGYNVGSLYYYQGSKLPIEWTNQHSCHSPNSHCEFVLQYMCSDQLRDGVTTRTIPDNRAQCQNYNCDTDSRYGMHEDYLYYLNCKFRERNRGLFVADQLPVSPKVWKKRTAIYTRQNPQGTRRGYECPEERDYYPYWHPSPWKDVAILTNYATRCPYYQKESQNVKSRWFCEIPRDVLYKNERNWKLMIPNNKKDCEAFRWPYNDKNGTRATWKEVPSHGLPAPKCRETEFTRDNHLGNGVGGYPILFNWTVPDSIQHEKCALRIRYNISTADYDPWDGKTNVTHSEEKNGQGTKVDLTKKYKFKTAAEAKTRGYVFKNNPDVDVFGDGKFTLRLAMNTAQYGRTFQDRTHLFAVRPRPGELKGVNIKNVNVRGKRGNIVQVYPAVEYDFVPNTAEFAVGDYIHFQWTGSNTNPNNNDGQGKAGTDRSNVVLQAAQVYKEGTFNHSDKFGHWGRSYPAHLNDVRFLGFSKDDLQKLALLGPGQFRGEMSELDDAGTYFDLGPRKVTGKGTYHYMCTRNNNFSNRSQKGKIVCRNYNVLYESIGWNGGSVKTDGLNIKVHQGTFDKLHKMKVEKLPEAEAMRRIAEKDRNIPVGDGLASDAYVIHPQQKLTTNGKKFQVSMNIETPATGSVDIYRTNTDSFATWTRVDAQISNGVANFAVEEGGAYFAVRSKPIGLIVGLVVFFVALVLVIAGTAYYFRRHPDKWQALVSNTRNMQRSTQAKV